MALEEGLAKRAKNLTAILIFGGALNTGFKYFLKFGEDMSFILTVIALSVLAIYQHENEICYIKEELENLKKKGAISFVTAIVVVIFILLIFYILKKMGG